MLKTKIVLEEGKVVVTKRRLAVDGRARARRSAGHLIEAGTVMPTIAFSASRIPCSVPPRLESTPVAC